MKVAIVHNTVTNQDSADARDVLVQADAVSRALETLGHLSIRLSCDLDLKTMAGQLRESAPDLVFNLVEDLGGYGRLIHCFPSLLDVLRIPYTGSPAEAIYLSSHKTLAKQLMRSNGLPTPAWFGPDTRPNSFPQQQLPDGNTERKWIIKSLWEHASLGLGADSVLETADPRILATEIAVRSPNLGGSCFAEEYIEGREFNLSVLETGSGPKVMDPAEIIFQDYEPDMVRIVDYQAKWDEDSFGYHNTVRSFEFAQEDATLLARLKDLAIGCWHIFGLRGYARVDFRVNPDGEPFILEINANPCLSPDAGFAAATGRTGIDFSEVVRLVLSSANRFISH